MWSTSVCRRSDIAARPRNRVPHDRNLQGFLRRARTRSGIREAGAVTSRGRRTPADVHCACAEWVNVMANSRPMDTWSRNLMAGRVAVAQNAVAGAGLWARIPLLLAPMHPCPTRRGITKSISPPRSHAPPSTYQTLAITRLPRTLSMPAAGRTNSTRAFAVSRAKSAPN